MRKRKNNAKTFSSFYQDGPMPARTCVERAFQQFLYQVPFIETECLLTPFLSAERGSDWLRRAREAKLLSMESVAEKLCVSKAAYGKMESAERNMAIRLATLIRAAEAIDCELIYAIRPKNRERFARNLFETILPFAKNNILVQMAPADKKARPLAGEVLKLMNCTYFRQDMGWVEKRPKRR